MINDSDLGKDDQVSKPLSRGKDDQVTKPPALSIDKDDQVSKPLSRGKDDQVTKQPSSIDKDEEVSKRLSRDKDKLANKSIVDDIQARNIPVVNGNQNEIENRDSNFVFFFGVSASGKTVILSSILYYLTSQVGVLEPQLGALNTIEAEVLLEEILEKIRKGILPNRTTMNKVTRLDFKFIPNNKSKKVIPINITFLEIAGGHYQNISAGRSFHPSIDAYLRADIPLNFIIVTSYDTAQNDDTLINQFFHRLIQRGISLESANIILVVSKWDISGTTEVLNTSVLEEFVKNNLPKTNERINTYGLSKTYFTIGQISKTSYGENIDALNLESAELLSNWLYTSIARIPLDYPGTFWERIRFSLFP